MASRCDEESQIVQLFIYSSIQALMKSRHLSSQEESEILEQEGLLSRGSREQTKRNSGARDLKGTRIFSFRLVKYTICQLVALSTWTFLPHSSRPTIDVSLNRLLPTPIAPAFPEPFPRPLKETPPLNPPLHRFPHLFSCRPIRHPDIARHRFRDTL
jgi:hypothetical protein